MNCSFHQDAVVVIPAYHPIYSLVALVQKLRSEGYTLVVVDDGSGSGYNVIWDHIRPLCYLIRHGENRGKGAALKTAFRFIAENLPQVQIIATMDADGQHLPEDMAAVAACARRNPAALVLGSRAFDGEVPLRSRLGNTITRHVFSAVARTHVEDTQTGLRAFSADLLEVVCDVEGSRYEYEMNVLLRCARHGIPIIEVPIETVYIDEENSSSHFDSVHDSLRIYKNILRFASASFVSFVADYLLFLLGTLLLPASAVGLLAANVIARFGSAALNYTLNTRAVFHDGRPMRKTLPQYALLATFILVANSAVLAFFVNLVGIPPQIAKVLTEIILFILSFTIQSCVIYKRPAVEKEGASPCPALRENKKVA